MSFAVPAALLLYLAGGFELNGLATLEVRGGRAPILVNNPPRWGVVGIATPDIQLSYLSPRLDLKLDTAEDIATWSALMVRSSSSRRKPPSSTSSSLFTSLSNSIGRAKVSA